MINLKSTIIIENNKYLFKNKVYEDFQVGYLQKKLGNKLRIVILGEDLWIKKLKCINKDYDKFIEDEIRLVNDPNGDLLHHNHKDKKNKTVFIYSIKGKKVVEKIIHSKKNIEIIPIQFLLLNKVLKEKRLTFISTAIAEIKDYYYIISVDNGKIISSDVLSKKENEKDILIFLKKLNREKLLIDNSVSEELKSILKEGNINFNLLKGQLCENL